MLGLSEDRDQFELGLIGWCLQNSDAFSYLVKQIRKKHFQDLYAVNVWPFLLEQWERHGAWPTEGEAIALLQTRMRTNALLPPLIDYVKKCYAVEVSEVTGEEIKKWVSSRELLELANKLQEAASNITALNQDDLLVKVAELKLEFDDAMGAIEGEEFDDDDFDPFCDEAIENLEDDIEEDYGADPLPTGFARLDAKLKDGGVRPHGILVFGPTGGGKAQPLYEPILTPNGFVPMGSIRVGDKVIGECGNPVEVSGVFPQGKKKIVSVNFNDGTSTHCCEDHLWKVRRYDSKKWTVLATKDLTHEGNRKQIYHVPVVKAVKLPERNLPMDPYLLGLLLGNGGLSAGSVYFSTGDEYLCERVRELIPPQLQLKHYKNYDYIITPVGKSDNVILTTLRSLGLLGKNSAGKFIPSEYLLGSVSQRTGLLQGIMDTDGHARGDNRGIDYVTASEQLCSGVENLVRSLGGIARRGKTKFVKGVPYYRTYLKPRPEIQPFTLPRKAEAHTPPTKYPCAKMISSITPIGYIDCQCIMVDSEDHTYVTSHYSVTHNTMLVANIQMYNVSKGKRGVHISFDDARAELRERFYGHIMCEEIEFSVLKATGMMDLFKDELRSTISEQYPGRLIIKALDPEQYTPMDIIRMLERLQKKLYAEDILAGIPPETAGKLDFVTIDTGDQVKAESRYKSEWYEVGKTHQILNVIPKRFNCPLFVVVQGGQQTVGAPQLTERDIGEGYGKAKPYKLILGVAQTAVQYQTDIQVSLTDSLVRDNLHNLHNFCDDGRDRNTKWKPFSLCVIKNTRGRSRSGAANKVKLPMLINYGSCRIIENYTEPETALMSPQQTQRDEIAATVPDGAPIIRRSRKRVVANA